MYGYNLVSLVFFTIYTVILIYDAVSEKWVGTNHSKTNTKHANMQTNILLIKRNTKNLPLFWLCATCGFFLLLCVVFAFVFLLFWFETGAPDECLVVVRGSESGSSYTFSDCPENTLSERFGGVRLLVMRERRHHWQHITNVTVRIKRNETIVEPPASRIHLNSSPPVSRSHSNLMPHGCFKNWILKNNSCFTLNEKILFITIGVYKGCTFRVVRKFVVDILEVEGRQLVRSRLHTSVTFE